MCMKRVELQKWQWQKRVENLQGVPKKCNIAISRLDLFLRSNLTFPHVFRNQNFEFVPSGHISDAHSQSTVLFAR